MKSPVLSVIREVNFKETELGPLPADWQVVKLGDVAEVLDKKRIPLCEEDRLKRPGPYPYCGANGILDYIDSYLFDGEFVLLAEDGGYWGKYEPSAYLMYGKFWVNNHAHVLKGKERLIENYYLNYYLVFSDITQFISGTTRGKLTQGVMRSIPTPLPPLPEQKAIAYVLRTVQQAKEATEKVIATLKNLKKSLMRHLFTYGPVPLDKVDSVPLRETELGPLPEDWQVVRLGEIFDIKQGKSLSPKSREGPRKRPFLRTSNILWGYIDLSSVDEMHFDEKEEKQLSLQRGDLLVCEGGEIGRTAMWEGQIPLCLYQNHLHRLRSQRTDIIPLFYMYWMQAAWTILDLYGGSENRTTIPNLSQSRLSSLLIPLSPLPEQQEVASILQAVDRRIEAEEAYHRALGDLFKTLLNELMTGRIRVQGFATSESEVNT